jgi:hypothetical protein
MSWKHWIRYGTETLLIMQCHGGQGGAGGFGFFDKPITQPFAHSLIL